MSKPEAFSRVLIAKPSRDQLESLGLPTRHEHALSNWRADPAQVYLAPVLPNIEKDGAERYGSEIREHHIEIRRRDIQKTVRSTDHVLQI
jgi:hypothetical protein